MCYSAMVWADHRKFTKAFAAQPDLPEFASLTKRRLQGERIPMPKGMTDAFRNAASPQELEIKSQIDVWTANEETALQEGLFAQRKRLADAQRVLAGPKPTKKAQQDERIATNKINQALTKLSDLQRQEPKERDSRIFPGYFCPVMIWEDGRRVIKPMRYQCRPAGKPAVYDTKYPGTYNARRDNLEGFWKGQFGVSHGIMVVTSFFENVNRHRVEGRELNPGEEVQNQVLRFDPADGEPMLVACLYSHWRAPGQPDLLSFAAITDEPPPEVAAAGHDRCIIPLKAEHIDEWLCPAPSALARLYDILDDRQRPYYQHKLAA